MIKFKSGNGIEYKARLETEFYGMIDKRLKAILLDLADTLEQKLEKDVTITCLNRTLEENREVNGSPHSAHLENRAVDIRTWYFDKKEIVFIEKYLYDTWSRDMIYFKYHDAGSGNHIHINIKYKHRNDWS